MLCQWEGGHMGRTILKTIKTHRGNYVYDRNTHTVMPVDEESFGELRAYEQGKLDEEHCHALQNFRNMGILEENVVKEIRHPNTDFLEHYADCRVRQVVLQVTQQCNLRCAYCVYSGNYFTREHSNKKMSIDTAKSAIDYTINHSSEMDEICFSFYGGEPLLELELIKKCVAYVKNQMIGRKYKFSITTNGTLLVPDTVKFLVENGFILSISLDGPQKDHDANRKFRSGQGSFSTIIKNISYIKENFFDFWRTIQILITLNPKVNLEEVITFFDEEEVIPKNLIQFNEVESTNLKNKELIKYQKNYYCNRKFLYLKMLMALAGMIDKRSCSKLFERMLEDKKEFIKGLKKGRRLQSCIHHGGPCIPGMKKLFVSVDGKFYPCEKVVENSDEISIGDIKNGLSTKDMARILNLGELTKKECLTCYALQDCKICIARIEGKDSKEFISKKSKIKVCEETRINFINVLYEYCIINECSERGE